MKMEMKKFAYVGAALLTSALGFTACSSSDDAADVNPNYDPATNSVKTQFAINIPSTTGTRASADNTQSGNPVKFLGLNDIYLLEYKADPTAAAQDAWTKAITLTEIAANSENWPETNKNVKIYNNVSIDAGTKYFLFYGVSSKAESGKSTVKEEFDYGTFKDLKGGLASATKKTDVKFELKNIVDGTSIAHADRDKILKTLNDVVAAKGEASKTWREYATDANNTDATLTKLFTKFTGLKAGSSNSVQRTLQALYNQVSVLATTENNTDESKLANAIMSAIATTDGAYTVANKTVSTTTDYPNVLNLPDGAVSLSYKDGSFAYAETQTSDGKVLGLDNLNPLKMCYPAPLAYWVSTPIKTSDNAEASFPTTTEAWEAGQSWSNFTGSEVTATTQAIALEKSINYGVANLKLSAKVASNNLLDNTTPSPASVNVPTDGLTISGVIVGAQPANVDYTYTPSSTEKFESVVYDKNVISNWAATTNSGENYNYTILLPSKKASEDGSKVKFAIELTNTTGASFYGVNGIVEDGAKFYLVGELDGNSGTKTDASSTLTNDRVFMSDVQTTVNVTINSLANAYNTIPDLSATTTKIGLAVNLKWQAGFTYDVTIQ